MEVRGHILAPGTYSPAGVPAGRLQELRERQRSLRQVLGLRLRELRRLCLQEAELTGQLPPEYPLEPGERPQPPPRRRSAGAPRGPPPEVSRARREAHAQVQVQAQVLEAARRLAAVPGLAPEQRRRRQRLQAEAAQRLRQLRAQLGAPGHDENGSLCELPALENGALPPPTPPPAGPGRPSPPGPVPPGRRSSLASPASPARTLPRSASSLEGRSVPATPVLTRSARGTALTRRTIFERGFFWGVGGGPEAPGLPPRPWSGSQDSQLGGPPTPNPPPAGAPRTRRSNSSEALIDWGGGAPPETPPEPSRPRGLGGGLNPGLPCGPPSAEQRRSQKWLALEGLRDWYLRHTGTPPAPRIPPPASTPPGSVWVPPQRRRDPPGGAHPGQHPAPGGGLPHSLSYAGALAPRSSGDTPGATPPPPLDPQPPGTLV
ncbi:coiled-coil domain-containing protein 120 [Sylvia borin]